MRVLYLFAFLASALVLLGEDASGPVITVRKGTSIVIETKEFTGAAGAAASNVLKNDVQLSGALSAGDASTANKRTINKYIHADGIKSCQLVMGLTILHEGSVWNTMPPHTHDRRMEAYFYFDLPTGQKIFHLMGQGDETRHITVNNYEAVVSPPWSIHSGSGTSSYGFIWGMAGENLDYTDMDLITIPDIK